MTAHAGMAMDGQAQASAALEQLAEALTEDGYHVTVVTPAPYLAILLPGAVVPYMIYSSGGRYWWHNAQDIASTSQATRAAELITWGLRNLAHGAHGTTSPPAGRGGEQKC